MKIYTKKGDTGHTHLADGTRVSKEHLRMQCIGDLDELNSLIGIIRSHNSLSSMDEQLSSLQDALFCLGADLAAEAASPVKKAPLLQEGKVEELEKEIDVFAQHLQPLKRFILPGGHVVASYLHLARSITRRAERDLVALHHQHTLRPAILQFMNRLSDWFFMAARYMNTYHNVPEVTWNNNQP